MPPQPTSAPFGERLRELRAAAGLTQEELAERAGLTPHGISALERGARTRPYPHTVRAIATALELDPAATSDLLASLPRRAPRAPADDVAADDHTEGSGASVRDGHVEAPLTDPADRLAHQAAAPSSRLGVPTTRLHGREDDVETVLGLLRTGRRLVSVVGPGGVGKTRLVASVAERLADAYDDGVLAVPLAHVSEPAQVHTATADALSIPGADAVDTSAALAGHLAGRRMLLVLDNLEQVAGVGATIAELVGQAPDLSVLTTSRIPLRVRDETVHILGPLGVPQRAVSTLDAVAGSGAGGLFLERAAASASHLPLRESDAPVVGEICRRLDGIPLAIELAVAHLGALGPDRLLTRLADALDRSAVTDLPDRQRTLHSTLEWSRQLLDPREQRLLRRLSAFRGGFTLEAAEAVDPDGPSETWRTVSLLVEHSWVQPTRARDGSPRYRLLEPVAAYAASLMTAEEAREARTAQATAMLGLAEEAQPRYAGAGQIAWLDHLDVEDANLTAALSWFLGDGADPDGAARLGWALWLFWWLRGRQHTGRTAMEQVLSEELADPVRANALLTHAAMTFAQGDLDASAPSWLAAEELARGLGDAATTANGRAGSGLVALARGDVDAAEAAFTAALDMAEGRPEWFAEWVVGLTHVWLGTVALLRGDLEGAERQVRRALEHARAREDQLTTYVALFNLAQVALAGNDPGTARVALDEAAELSVETRDAANLAFVLDALAVVEQQESRPGRVPLLLGAAEAMRDLAGARVYGYYVPDDAQRDAAGAAARDHLGTEGYDELVARGRALDFDEAVLAARGNLPDR